MFVVLISKMSTQAMQLLTIDYGVNMTNLKKIGFLIFTLCNFQIATAADQANVDYSSSYHNNTSSGSNSTAVMWGGASGGMVTMSGTWATGGSLESSMMHQMNGTSAGYVESARNGLLYAHGTSISIQSIGAQNIVSSTIFGDGNNVEIKADQSATNSGNISTTGSISTQPPANAASNN
jgi:hypothetical protein